MRPLSLLFPALLVIVTCALALNASAQGVPAEGSLAESPAAATAQPGPAGAEPPVVGAPEVSAPTATSASSANDASRRHDLTVALGRADRRFVSVEDTLDRQGIAGPLTLLITGTVIGTFFGVGALAVGSSIGDVKRDIDQGSYDELNDTNDDGVIDNRDLKGTRRLTIGFATVSAFHFGLAAFGTWWLFKRVDNRKRLNEELRDIDGERNVLQMKLDLSADANGFHGYLVGRF